MADDRIREEIITNFFLETCRPSRRIGEYDACVLMLCAKLADIGDIVIPSSTGSVAEFYVEPMLSCVGDVDIMFYFGSLLAIPKGYLPPTQLPGEFNSHVKVYEIVNTDFPGYVHLVSRYLLTECEEDDKYKAVKLERAMLTLGRASIADLPLHGPAVVLENEVPFNLDQYTDDLRRSMDCVYCVRCLLWPSQAADWPTRHRNYDWPDSTTVDLVVSNGCDVVPVAHPMCREDEWMNKRQFRLSFSRAEIVLLNSWMRVQQIVYHMLRMFMKKEILTERADNAGAGTLSNYHIKTLMLWACELKSRSWWTDDLNLVRICVELLHTLAVWLTDACIQHYFINNCNLFYQFQHSQFTKVTVNQLMSITRARFCEWCIDSYICKCVQRCPGIDQTLMLPSIRLMHDVVCLQNTVSMIVAWRRVLSPWLTSRQFFVAQHIIIKSVSLMSLTSQSCLCFLDQLAKSDQVLQLYFTAVVLLHVAYKTTQSLMTDEMLDVVATMMCLQFNDVCHCRNARHSSVLLLSQAAILMKVVVNSSQNTVQLIEIELAKAYLHRALRCKDSDSNFIYCLANVYLSVLYAGQSAINHCALVTRSQDHSQCCSSHVVQGELLPRIHDQVDTVLGLAVFYEYIRAAALSKQQERRHVSVFIIELFARYLQIKLLSIRKCRELLSTSLADEVQRYRNCLCSLPEVFVTDVMLFNFTNHTNYPSNDRLVMANTGETKSLTSSQFDTSELVALLQQFAVEHLTTCRELQTPEFGTFGNIVTPDFKALYAYKCGQYECCLQLSVYTVHNLIADIDDNELSVVYFVPQFVQLMDDNIVSLIALMTLANPSHNKNWPLPVAIRQLSLSLYLMTQCQIKLRHSVTSLDTSLNYVQFARGEIMNRTDGDVIDQLVLKFVEQKLLRISP